MRLLQSIQWQLLTLTSCLFISACGGGGGTSEPNIASGTRTALPTVITDQEPTGALVELDSTYFASQVGDTYEFITTNAAGYQSTRQRLVVAHPSAINGFVLEDTEGGETWSTDYLRDTNGWRQDFRHYSDIPQGARSIMGTILEFPSHVSERGQTRRSVRQGGWDEDLDGDRINESFRLEFVQRFVGLEPEVQFGKTLTLAHFQTTVTFSLVYSRADSATQTVVTTEDTYFAQGFGQVRMESTERVPGGGIISVSKSRVKDSMSGGKSWADYIRTNGTKIPVDLTFRDMVYDKDRNVYYASVPEEELIEVGASARVPPGSNSIATVDAITGQTTFSVQLGTNPGPLAISSDGSRLWVGIDRTNEIVEMSLPSMIVTGRIAIQSHPELANIIVPVTQIKASPVDPNAFAAVLSSFQSVAVVMVKDMVIQPRILTTSDGNNVASLSPRVNAVEFDPTGQLLYGIDWDFSPPHLSTFNVSFADNLPNQPAGLYRQSSVPYSTFISKPWRTNLDLVGSQLILENQLISLNPASTDYFANTTACRKLGEQKAVCSRFQTDPSGFISGIELVPVALPSSTEDAPISMGRAMTNFNPPSMVAGPVGQIAFGWREGTSFSDSPFNRLVLFHNPQLR